MSIHDAVKRLVNILGSQIYLTIKFLLLLSGDIEINPDPNEQSGACLSIIHQNIRSIRNKFDYIQDHFLDFEIICFTETHLDNVSIRQIIK